MGLLYGRIMDHIPAQYELQEGKCAGCGRELPTVADGLLRMNGELECITCAVNGHDSPS